MKQYIDKSAVVAEIERRLEEYRTYPDYQIDSNYMELCDILSFLDTLETKEVDLEAELNTWRHNHFHGRRDADATGEYLERASQLDLARHFFILGLKAKRE